VVAVKQGSTLSVYVNSVIGTNATLVGNQSITSGSTKIGSAEYLTNPYYYVFNGSLDDVMIFNRSLTSEEVLSLYNATRLQHSRLFLSDGNHTFSAYAQDYAGNINSSEIEFFNTESLYSVSRCRSLTQSGYYTQTQDIIISEYKDACINITAGNVTLDCNGYYILDNTYDSGIGIYANNGSGSGPTNVIIKNCNVSVGVVVKEYCLIG
jgi:hypothetical protein